MNLNEVKLEKESFDELKSILLLYLDKECGIIFSDQTNTKLTYYFIDEDEGKESFCPEFYNLSRIL